MCTKLQKQASNLKFQYVIASLKHSNRIAMLSVWLYGLILFEVPIYILNITSDLIISKSVEVALKFNYNP